MIEPDALRTIAFLTAIVTALGQLGLEFVPEERKSLSRKLKMTFGAITFIGLVISYEAENIISSITESRHVRSDASRKLVDTLKNDPWHQVVVVSAAFDRGADEYADEFVEPFFLSNWWPSRVRNWARSRYGVAIGKVDERELPGEKSLDHALDVAGIKHITTRITEDDVRSISPEFASGFLYLLIGPQPKPS